MIFEWDENKAAENLRKHDVSFDEATEVWNDPNRFEEFDTKHSDTEQRFSIIGFSTRRLLYVVYCERIGDVIRLITARKVTKRQEKVYVETNQRK